MGVDYSETDDGFTSLTADNDYLYGSYSGTKDGNGITRIGIWKWDGSPVKLIETDAQILKIALSEDSKTLYAITKKENE